MLLEAIRGPFDRLQHRRVVYLSDALAVSWIAPGPFFTASSRVPIKMASGAFRYQNANGKQCVWWPTRACRGDPLAPYSLRELRPPGLEFCGNSRDLRQWSTERFPVEIGVSPSLSCWGWTVAPWVHFLRCSVGPLCTLSNTQKTMQRNHSSRISCHSIDFQDFCFCCTWARCKA